MQKDDVTKELMQDRARKSRVPLLVGITIAILAIAVVVIVVVVVIQANSPQRKIRKLLDQGRQFISELEYERAIASIDEILEIDPKNEEALELKAEVYQAWAKSEEKAGNYEKALKIAKEGYEDTEDRKLKKLITKLEETLESSGETEKEGAGKAGKDDPAGETEKEKEPKEKELSEEEEKYLTYKSYLTPDKLEEGVAYYQKRIQENPKDVSAYGFGAALCLVKDDAVSALTVLEAGIAAGADRDALMKKEAYVRENTVMAASYGTVVLDTTLSYEVGGTYNDNTYYDEFGRKVRRETTNNLNGNLSEYFEYDKNGKIIHSAGSYLNGSSQEENYYQYNERGDVTYHRIIYKYGLGSDAYYSDNETYTEYEYDSLGRVLHEIESQSGFTTDIYYEYDVAGNVTHVRKAAKNYAVDTYYEYDAKGNVIHEKETSDYGGYDTYYTYDGMVGC